MNYFLNRVITAFPRPIACLQTRFRRSLLLRLPLVIGLVGLASDLQAGKPAVPTAPSGLYAVAVSSSQINLTWQDNASNETGFTIERSPNGGTWSQIATVGASVTSYSSTGLSAGSTYYYRVRAYNSRGSSAYSNTAGATTQEGSSCSYFVSPTGASYDSSGGGGSVGVTAGAGCGWTASSGAGWITITSGGSGSGSGTVTYSVAANTSTSTRTGSLTIAGQGFSVTQTGSSGGGGGGGGGGDVPLSNGAPYNDSLTASASQSGWKFYYIDVPAGSSGLVIDLYNMTADVDLYVRYNAQPTLSAWDCRPYIGGTSEQCSFSVPAGGRWWIGVDNWATGTINYTVSATVSGSTGDTTPPNVPSGLTASAVSSSQINLAWYATTDSGGSGVAGYIVYRNGVQIATTTSTSFPSTGLAPSTQYCYSVAAYDGAGNTSGASQGSCATTATAADTTPPNVPSGLTTSTASSSQINLAWYATTDSGGSGVAGYIVYRNGLQIATTTSTSFPSTGLAPSTQYCYSVAAYDGAGNTSGASQGSCATTATAADTTPPNVPSGLTTSTASSSQINLAWYATTDSGGSGVAGYVVYQNGVQIATTTSTSYPSTGLAPSTQYCYSVAAYDGAGNTSGASQGSCATTAAAADTTPPSATLTAPANGAIVSGTITLSATANDNVGVTRVEFYCDGGTYIGTDTTAPYSVSCDTTAIPNGVRTFSCRAYDAAGNYTTSAANTVTVNNQTVTAGPWVKSFGGVSSDAGQAVAVDGSGNVFVAGYFMSSIDFGNGTGSLFGAGDFDMFIAKFTSAGVPVWSRGFGGAGKEFVTSIALDASGNIFVGGYFGGTTDLGKGPMASGGGYDMFVAKYSGAGAPIWVKTFGTGGFDSVTGLAVDGSGNVVVSGFIQGSPIDFGGGALWNAPGGYDSVLVKLSGADGSQVWARAFASDTDNQANAVTIDSAGDIVVVGHFGGNVDLSNNTGVLPWPVPASALATHGSYDLYIGKFRTDGTFLWSKGFGGGQGDRALAVAVDGSRNIFVTGYFTTSMDLGLGAMTAATSNPDPFLAKFSSSGTAIWSKSLPGGHNQIPSGLAVDSSGNVSITGVFDYWINLGGGTVNSTALYQNEVFVAKYSGATSGLNPNNYLWGKLLGGSTSQSYGITTDSSGYVITTGWIMGPVTVDGQTITNLGWSDIDLLKFNP